MVVVRASAGELDRLLLHSGDRAEPGVAGEPGPLPLVGAACMIGSNWSAQNDSPWIVIVSVSGFGSSIQSLDISPAASTIGSPRISPPRINARYSCMVRPSNCCVSNVVIIASPKVTDQALAMFVEVLDDVRDAEDAAGQRVPLDALVQHVVVEVADPHLARAEVERQQVRSKGRQAVVEAVLGVNVQAEHRQ